MGISVIITNINFQMHIYSWTTVLLYLHWTTLLYTTVHYTYGSIPLKIYTLNTHSVYADCCQSKKYKKPYPQSWICVPPFYEFTESFILLWKYLFHNRFNRLYSRIKAIPNTGTGTQVLKINWKIRAINTWTKNLVWVEVHHRRSYRYTHNSNVTW